MKEAFLKRLEKQTKFDELSKGLSILSKSYSDKMSRVNSIGYALDVMKDERSNVSVESITSLMVEKDVLLKECSAEMKPMNNAAKVRDSALEELSNACTEYNKAKREYIEELENSYII